MDKETSIPATPDAQPGKPTAVKKKALGSRSKTKARPAKTQVRSAKSAQARRGSKKAKLLALLKRPGGASLEQLIKATGWQAHSVRGFLSGELNRRMGLRVLSSKPEGKRIYRLSAA